MCAWPAVIQPQLNPLSHHSSSHPPPSLTPTISQDDTNSEHGTVISAHISATSSQTWQFPQLSMASNDAGRYNFPLRFYKINAFLSKNAFKLSNVDNLNILNHLWNKNFLVGNMQYIWYTESTKLHELCPCINYVNENCNHYLTKSYSTKNKNQ